MPVNLITRSNTFVSVLPAPTVGFQFAFLNLLQVEPCYLASRHGLYILC